MRTLSPASPDAACPDLAQGKFLKAEEQVRVDIVFDDKGARDCFHKKRYALYVFDFQAYWPSGWSFPQTQYQITVANFKDYRCGAVSTRRGIAGSLQRVLTHSHSLQHSYSNFIYIHPRCICKPSSTQQATCTTSNNRFIS